jgi:hypothetical protein
MTFAAHVKLTWLGVDKNIEQRLPIANPLDGGNFLVVSAPP